LRNLTVIKVKIWAKFSAKIDSTLIFFVEIITKLLIDFSRDTILFLIYLLSDKGNFDYLFYYIYEYYEIMFELICHIILYFV